MPTIGREVVAGGTDVKVEGEGGSGGGHVQPDRESAGPAPESADLAWQQLDLIRWNWEEKRSRRLEEEEGGGGGGVAGAEGMVTIYHDVPPNN